MLQTAKRGGDTHRSPAQLDGGRHVHEPGMYGGDMGSPECVGDGGGDVMGEALGDWDGEGGGVDGVSSGTPIAPMAPTPSASSDSVTVVVVVP